MAYVDQLVLGPKVASVSKEDALIALQTHPQYPKGAIVASFEDVNGDWIAKLKKVAAPFPPDDSASEEPSGEEGPPKPKDDGGGEEKPDDPFGGGDESGLPGEEGGKPKKPSVEESVMALTDLVHQIADALGVAAPGHPGAGPEIGGPPMPPDPMGGGPAGGHAGPGRPPQGPGGQSAMMRARPLKPGEAPNSPGVTPVGAPAFASVDDNHPWKSMLGKTATFTASDQTDASIAQATAQLHELAETAGLPKSAVKQVREGRDDQGNRVLKALIHTRG